jgi:hypothetical protein
MYKPGEEIDRGHLRNRHLDVELESKCVLSCSKVRKRSEHLSKAKAFGKRVYD